MSQRLETVSTIHATTTDY